MSLVHFPARRTPAYRSVFATLFIALISSFACAQEEAASKSTQEAMTPSETHLANSIKAENTLPAKPSVETPEKTVGKADPNAESPRAYIISPKNGDQVSPTFKVVFGLAGMGVAPAGVVKEGTGHHHLLIDVDQMPALNRPLPSTDNIRHFGGGQTETWVTLKPGTHSLQMLLGDFAHIPHSTPILSKKITVTVAAP